MKRAFHYKGLMMGLIPVWIDDIDATIPSVQERHWSLMPFMHLVIGLCCLFDFVCGLFIPHWEGGVPFKITAYIDPPVWLEGPDEGPD